MAQIGGQHAVGVVLARHRVVELDRPLPVVGVAQEPLGFPDHVVGYVIVHQNGAEPLGTDVAGVDRVVVHEDRLAVVDRLQEGVAEALEQRRVGDQIGVRVDVVQGIDLAALRRGRAPVVDHPVDEQRAYSEHFGVVADPLLVLEAFVARGVGDDQDHVPVPVQMLHQLDGVFDALALHDARGLQHEDVVLPQPQRAAHVGVVVVDSARRVVEVHHVGDQVGIGAGAQRQLVARRAVDHHVGHRVEPRRVGVAQVVGHATDHEALALPGEVVVMGDGGDAGLGDHFGDGQAEGNVERDRQGVLGHQHVERKAFDELVEALFQFPPQLVDLLRDPRLAGVGVEQIVGDLLYLRVPELRLGEQNRAFGRSLQLAAAIVAAVAHALQYGGPLGGFQRHAVGSREAERHEPDVAPAHGRSAHVAGGGQLGQLGRDDGAAVGSAGIAREVILVVLLGGVEALQRYDLGDDGPPEPRLRRVARCLGAALLGVVVGQDDGPVLRADVVTLAVARGGIVSAPEQVEDLGVAHQPGVEGDLDHLRMAGAPAADCLVGRVRGAAAGIAGHYLAHPADPQIDRLHAPEAAAAQGGRGTLRRARHGRPPKTATLRRRFSPISSSRQEPFADDRLRSDSLH